MTLRRTVDSDIDYIKSCIKRSVEQSVTDVERDMSDLWIDTILAISERSILSGMMEDETFVLIDENGSYAGSLWLGKSSDQFTCDDTGYVLGIFVEPHMRCRGLGSYLLSVAESWCREKGYLHLTLNVGWHNENARRFYDSHGYMVRSEVRRKELYPPL